MFLLQRDFFDRSSLSPRQPTCPWHPPNDRPAATRTAFDQEKPPAVSRRGSLRDLVRRRGSEVALNAKIERNRVLVLERVDVVGGLAVADRECAETAEALLQMHPDRLGRERQVLDRGPTGDHTQFRSSVVRVAGVGNALTCN